jgi:hypothetical protein
VGCEGVAPPADLHSAPGSATPNSRRWLARAGVQQTSVSCTAATEGTSDKRPVVTPFAAPPAAAIQATARSPVLQQPRNT